MFTRWSTILSVLLVFCLLAGCASPAVSGPPVFDSREPRTDKSQVILDLTRMDTNKWPQALQEFLGLSSEDLVLIVAADGNSSVEEAVIAIPVVLTQYSPIYIGTVIPSVGLSYFLFTLTFSPQDIAAIQSTVNVSHELMWTTVANLIEVQKTAAVLQEAINVVGAWERTIEWTDVANGSKHYLHIKTDIAAWTCTIEYRTTMFFDDTDPPREETVSEKLDEPRFCLPQMIYGTMLKAAAKIGLMTGATQAAKDKIASWIEGLRFTLGEGWRLFLLRNGIPEDPQWWTPK